MIFDLRNSPPAVIAGSTRNPLKQGVTRGLRVEPAMTKDLQLSHRTGELIMENNKNKMNIKRAGFVLAGLLIVMIFLSNTAYSYNQPVVTAVSPSNGKLNKTEKASGITNWTDKKDVYSKLSGTVGEILVEEGDMVKAGQELLYMEYDRDDIEEKLKEIEIDKRKNQLGIETAELKIEKAKDNIKTLEEELYKTYDISVYDINEAQCQVENLERELEDARVLYEAGAISKSELDKSSYELEGAVNKLESLRKQYEDNVSKSTDELSDKEKNRESQINSYNQEIKELNQQIKSLSLDYESLVLQESIYNNQLDKFSGNEVILAPADGKIDAISIKNGSYINEHTLMLSLGLGCDYTIECTVPTDNNFIFEGDVCLVYNTAHRFEAVVSKITAAEKGKTIKLSLASEDITSGETFDIEFKKTSELSYTLIPNGAVNMDTNGYFIYQISRRDGIMGKEYYAAKISVEIGDKDNENTAITKGISFFEPIVLLSDKPFEEKQTIKIKNESDFFDN